MFPAPVCTLRETAVSAETEPGLPLASWAATTTLTALPDTTLAPELTEVITSLVAVGSPIAKLLKPVRPFAVVLWLTASATDPLGGEDHVPELSILTMKFDSLAPPRTS